MGYIPPQDVKSPRDRLRVLRVLHDGGEWSWSVALVFWDEEYRLAFRWNGGSDDPNQPSKGNPQSRGLPTWTMLPNDDDWHRVIIQELMPPGVSVPEFGYASRRTEAAS